MAFWHRAVCRKCGLVVDKRHPAVKAVKVLDWELPSGDVKYTEYYCGSHRPAYDSRNDRPGALGPSRYLREFFVDSAGTPFTPVRD